MKLLLHACCGPCSLEPTRLLRAAGHEIALFYANSNIAPAEEYDRRLATLRDWAVNENLSVIEGVRNPDAWENTAGRMGKAQGNPARREARCRACYRLRLEETAAHAREAGFDGIGTTLSVSPYQYTKVIREELERAAAKAGIAAVFEDFRPFYDEATRRSRALGMYRQNYCGCRFSDEEAAEERAERKAQRAAKRAAETAAHAEERAAEEAAQAAKRADKQAYANKQAKKRAILKALREKERSEKAPDER